MRNFVLSASLGIGLLAVQQFVHENFPGTQVPRAGLLADVWHRLSSTEASTTDVTDIVRAYATSPLKVEHVSRWLDTAIYAGRRGRRGAALSCTGGTGRPPGTECMVNVGDYPCVFRLTVSALAANDADPTANISASARKGC